MGLNRRTVLAATGVFGAGPLGIGYWQRRRLVRCFAISDFRGITGIEVPQIEDDPVISMPLLESAYDRAVTITSATHGDILADPQDCLSRDVAYTFRG